MDLKEFLSNDGNIIWHIVMLAVNMSGGCVCWSYWSWLNRKELDFFIESSNLVLLLFSTFLPPGKQFRCLKSRTKLNTVFIPVPYKHWTSVIPEIQLLLHVKCFIFICIFIVLLFIDCLHITDTFIHFLFCFWKILQIPQGS